MAVHKTAANSYFNKVAVHFLIIYSKYLSKGIIIRKLTRKIIPCLVLIFTGSINLLRKTVEMFKVLLYLAVVVTIHWYEVIETADGNTFEGF